MSEITNWAKTGKISFLCHFTGTFKCFIWLQNCFRNLVLLEVIFFDISISHTDVFQYDGNNLGQSFCRLVTWFLVDSLIFLCWYACLPVPQNTPHQEKNPELLDFADLSSCSTFSRVVCFESGKYFSLILFMLLLLLWGRAVVKRKMSGDRWWRGREVYISSSFQSNFESCEIVILSYSDNRKKQWLLKRKQSPPGKQTFPLTYQSNPIG